MSGEMVGAKEHRTTDTEMSDVMSTQQHQVPNDNNVRELLTLARQLINQGNPSQALQAVVMAMRTKGGDQAVFQSLHRARELYLNRLQESTAADQLASLFAECAITEAQPLQDEQTRLNIGDQSPSAVPHVRVNSILAETGRAQLMLDAFSDGSSFICLKRARELYLNRLQESTAADQLASLFAECAITEAQPLQDEQTRLNIGDQSPSAVPHVRVNSILAETGRAQLMLDAFSDGSSFICLKCGGLVSNYRKDKHYAYWCG